MHLSLAGLAPISAATRKIAGASASAMARIFSEMRLVAVQAEAAQSSSSGEADSKPKRKLEVKVPDWCGKWVVSMDAFKDGVVGAKSKNIAGTALHSVSEPCKVLAQLQSCCIKCCMLHARAVLPPYPHALCMPSLWW